MAVDGVGLLVFLFDEVAGALLVDGAEDDHRLVLAQHVLFRLCGGLDLALHGGTGGFIGVVNRDDPLQANLA